ncbi:MAG: single-stranded DNA-binding protein [Mycobacterium sp.]
MFETPLTVVGRIVTAPTRHHIGNQDVVKFRIASNTRRRSADGEWEPGNSLFLSVNCWGRLGTGVIASVGKGDAVIVSGHVYTSEYHDREGVRRSSVELRATAAGPDLSRYIARIEKLTPAQPLGEPADTPPEDGETVDPSDADSPELLTLSA